MRFGGNNKCNDFLATYNIKKETPIPQKYSSAAAIYYKDRYAVYILGCYNDSAFTTCR